jgi:hypothetical protein
MHPLDLAAHREQRLRQQHRQLARAIRLVLIHSTQAEGERMVTLAESFRAGRVGFDEAHRQIGDLRRDQNRRRAA